MPGQLRTRLESLAKIGTIRCPMLQSHGTDDEIIPIELGRRLHAAAGDNGHWIELRGLRHNDPEPPEYHAALDAFLDSLPTATSDRPGIKMDNDA